MWEAVFVLSIIALTVLGPLLIIMHYVTRWKESRELSTTDEQMLEELWQLARKMEERVDVLETILDESAPDWRKKL